MIDSLEKDYEKVFLLGYNVQKESKRRGIGRDEQIKNLRKKLKRFRCVYFLYRMNLLLDGSKIGCFLLNVADEF